MIVHYMTYDENKQLVQISPDETLTGALGETYHAQIKQIDDYVFSGVKEGDSITGIFSDEPKEITLIYGKAAKEKGIVLVQYQDEAGKPLAGDELSSGEIGSDYTTVQKDIEGYTLKEIKGNAAGKYTSGVTQVIYVYTKNPAAQGKVTVHYQDEEQNPLSADVVLTGDVETIYTAEVKPFDGYVLKGIDGQVSGTFTTQDQEVTLIYAKKGSGTEKGVLIVEYQDETGHPLLNSEVTIAEVGEKYTTVQKEIDGYEFSEVKGNTEGEYVDGITKVTYVYKKITEPIELGSVTIQYQDEAGDEIAESFTGKQPIGTPLPIEKLNKEIAGYQWKEVKGLDSDARYKKEDQVITVIYKKQKSLVIVNYLTEEGKQLAKPLSMTDEVDSSYQTEEKKFKGYRLKERIGQAAGKYTLEPQVVTYIYTNKSTIKIQYVDEAGKELAPSEQKAGIIDEAYETTAKDIEGWTVKETPKNAKGTYQAEEQTITYVYVKAASKEVPVSGGNNPGNGQGNPVADGGTTTYATARTLPVAGQRQTSTKKLPATGEKHSGSLILTLTGMGIIVLIGMMELKRMKRE